MGLNLGRLFASASKAAGPILDERDQRQAQMQAAMKKQTLEERLQRERDEDRAAQQKSRTLEMALNQQRLDEGNRPKPMTPRQSRNTERGIEEFDNTTGVWAPTGRQPYQAPSQAQPKAPPVISDAERKAAAMGHRIQGVRSELNTFDNSKTLDALASRAGIMGNWATTAEGRRLRAAGSIWVTSVLRPESGATVSDKELDDFFMKYLPRPGDDDLTLGFKRKQRQIAEESVDLMADRALPSGGRGADKRASLPHP